MTSKEEILVNTLERAVIELYLTFPPVVVVSPAAVPGSPALMKGMSSISTLGGMDTAGSEPITGTC